MPPLYAIIWIEAQEFNWDGGNREKCRKHGVSIDEIEKFFRQKKLFISPDIGHSRKEEKFLAIGQSRKEKPMFVVFTLRKKNGNVLIRPISARYMHEKEMNHYEKERSKIQKR